MEEATAEAVGVDVGGTKVAAIRMRPDGLVLDRVEIATPSRDPEGSVAAIVEAARRMVGPGTVAIGVGAAGMVEFATGTLRYAPNIAYREVAISARVRDELGLPCLLDNDANAAAWGEHRFGAGRGSRTMLLVTVGTGIGGGLVLDGKLFRGAHGFAAEIGHTVVEPDGPPCGCGNRGCWETVASGSTVQRMGREVVLDLPSSRIAVLAGGDPTRVTGEMVSDAATWGDDAARNVLRQVGWRLGQGIAGLVNVIDPDLVVVGGGVAQGAGDLVLDPAREAYLEHVEGADHRPPLPIVAASLGNDAGAIGAAALALEELVGP
jgi:glucokinase